MKKVIILFYFCIQIIQREMLLKDIIYINIFKGVPGIENYIVEINQIDISKNTKELIIVVEGVVSPTIIDKKLNENIKSILKNKRYIGETIKIIVKFNSMVSKEKIVYSKIYYIKRKE